MKIIIDILEEQITVALNEIINDGNHYPAIVRESYDKNLWDYQANGIIQAAKVSKINAKELACKVRDKVSLDNVATVEATEQGFLNIKILPSYLWDVLRSMGNRFERFGGHVVCPIENPQTIIVDYSGPNIAKEMHVGHLRSTIIGDCICRMYEALGHDVLGVNHIGDWGTQIGMLCVLYEEKQIDYQWDDVFLLWTDVSFEEFYREAKQRYETDLEFAARADSYTTSVHAACDATESLAALQNISQRHRTDIYNKLNVSLTTRNNRAESYYKNWIQRTIDDLLKKEIAEVSDGVVCVFSDKYTTKDGTAIPLRLQRADGAFLYAAIDLTALEYRGCTKPDKIIYVADTRQKLHFEMVFDTARRAGYVPEDCELIHLSFGMVLGEDKKPFKTRSGDTVKLIDLLNEATQRAYKVVADKNPRLNESERLRTAEAVGIGAVKYADYANNITSDYIFDFDKMLAMDGDTAPYAQYACVRISSILKTITTPLDEIESFTFETSYEFQLANHIAKYPYVLKTAAYSHKPNYITSYVYKLAQLFNAFYENCPILQAEPTLRNKRLFACQITEHVFKHSLTKILRIEIPEQM